MTPEEKASQLVDKMDGFTYEDCKRNAIVCVKEILDCLRKYSGMHDQEFIDSDIAYYVSVQIEIEKL